MIPDYRIFKLVHLIAIMALFLAFGAAVVSEKGKRRWISPLHGIALLFILLTGFSMLSTLGIHAALPAWAIAKLGIWLMFGLSLVLAKRKWVPAPLTVTLLLLLGTAAGFCALWKP